VFSSEIRSYSVDHPIVLIDDEDRAPFVKRGTRMRDAAADKVAHSEIMSRWVGQIGVLVV
jgi:hypothetical protein